MIWPPPPQGGWEPPSRLPWWQIVVTVPEGPATNAEVLAWWAARRWTYNKIVFGLGIPSAFLCLLFFVIAAFRFPGENILPGDDIAGPGGLLFAPIIALLMVNICYSLGPVGELLWRTTFRVRTRQVGRLMMKAGMAFSLFIIPSPSVVWGAVLVWHLLTGHKVNPL